MTAARDQLHPTISKTRNRFVLNRARGFESHHLRQESQIQTNLRLFLCGKQREIAFASSQYDLYMNDKSMITWVVWILPKGSQ